MQEAVGMQQLRMFMKHACVHPQARAALFDMIPRHSGMCVHSDVHRREHTHVHRHAIVWVLGLNIERSSESQKCRSVTTRRLAATI